MTWDFFGLVGVPITLLIGKRQLLEISDIFSEMVCFSGYLGQLCNEFPHGFPLTFPYGYPCGFLRVLFESPRLGNP